MPMSPLIVVPLVFALALTAPSVAQNLAAGRPCDFSPRPNYGPTTEGDATDLTDGRLGEREDQCIWFEPHVVGWTYLPQMNVRVDLGQVEPIGEVVMRFLGGSAQPGLDFPCFVRLLVSDDDETYYQVAEYSRRNPGDDVRFAIPATEGKAWVAPLRFADLRTRGRYVGLVIGGTAVTCSDELYVYRGRHDPAAYQPDPARVADFSVTRPQLAFVKPLLTVTSNIATPQPILLLDESGIARTIKLHLEMPPGIELMDGPGGGMGVKVDDARTERSEAGTHYAMTSEISGQSSLPWAKLTMQASLPPGTQTSLRAWIEWEGGRSGVVTVPVTIAEIPPAPRCQRLAMGLGWWPLADTRAWPDGLHAARTIGLNTLATFTMWMDPEDQALWDFAREARQAGFRLMNVDSAWHVMMSRHKDEPDLFCQFADGTTGASFCPSYRGPAYAEEIKRVAAENARLRPDFLSEDVELWSWAGPPDVDKCTRCQADKAASGLATWEEWRLAKGYEMWRDLHDAVQAAVAAAGGEPVEIGGYDWRPGKDYQFFWPFDRLYRDGLVHNAQVSTYTPLFPYHIGLLGDEVRGDRRLMETTENLPWLSPGDAGVFTAEALRCAMLECFLNGSRGIHFWSNRYWDGESFLGYNQAVRAVAAAEDIIIDGQLYDAVSVAPPARVSAMIRGNDLALLVGEYYGHEPVTLLVTLEVPAASVVTDAETGERLGQLAAGQQTIAVSLGEHRSRVLLLLAE